MKKLLFLFSILLGCSASNETVSERIIIGEPLCAPLSGAYQFNFEKISGRCSEISSSTINTDYVGSEDCEVHKLVVSDSKCHYKIEFKCPQRAPGAHTELTGNLDLAADGESGTGLMHFVFFDDDVQENICVSDYNISFKRK